jgi:hypothetical protein
MPAIGAVSAFRYWIGLGAVSFGALALLTSAAVHGFNVDRQNARKTVDAVADQFAALQPLIFADHALSAGIPTDDVGSRGEIEWNLLTNGRLQPATVEAVRQLLRSRSGNQFLSIYFQTSSGAFVRASDGPAYKSPYMDIRYLRGSDTEDGNAYLVETMISQRRDISQPFLGYVFRPQREGRLLRAQDGTVFGVAISETDERPPALRTLALFACGFQCQDLEW